MPFSETEPMPSLSSWYAKRFWATPKKRKLRFCRRKTEDQPVVVEVDILAAGKNFEQKDRVFDTLDTIPDQAR